MARSFNLTWAYGVWWYDMIQKWFFNNDTPQIQKYVDWKKSILTSAFMVQTIDGISTEIFMNGWWDESEISGPSKYHRITKFVFSKIEHGVYSLKGNSVSCKPVLRVFVDMLKRSVLVRLSAPLAITKCWMTPPWYPDVNKTPLTASIEDYS